MNAYPNVKPALAPVLEELIASHGRLRLALLLLLALIKPPVRPPDARDLPDHLRRDIGLPDLPPAVPRLGPQR
jgi:hypothetical protein